MLYVMGYIFGILASITGSAIFLSHQHDASQFKPSSRQSREPILVETRTVISFSLILPFLTLGFVAALLVGVKISRDLIHQGHSGFVVAALGLPTLCFLTGYLYFRKVVQSQ